MNRNDMPFLGVYDNVRYSPNCTPTTYRHWGWGFVSEHFVPQVFFQTTLERGMADSNSIPFLVSILLTAMSLWSCIGKKMIEVNMNSKLLEYFFYIFGCLIMLYNFVDMIVQKIQGASNIYTQYNIPLWIIVGIGFVLIGRTIALQRTNNKNK